MATIYSALADKIGPPTPQAGSSKARALSYEPALAQTGYTPVLSLSPYLVQWPRDLSESIVGTDTEGEESGDRGLKLGRLIQGQKYKMGWYKVPCTFFDYAPAALNTVLVDRGVKELEERKISTATLIRFERDVRTLSLVGSFADMTGASAAKVINETLKDESLSQRTSDTLTGLADLEVFRGHAAFHSLSLASTLDTNLKLLRRQGVLSTIPLQPHLKR